jgi:hypothetical protein
MTARRAGVVAAALYVALGAGLAILAVFEDDPVAFAPVVLLGSPTTQIVGEAVGAWAVGIGVLVNAALVGGVVTGIVSLIQLVRGRNGARLPRDGA